MNSCQKLKNRALQDGLVYNDENHEYRYNGNKVPSVSQVISLVNTSLPFYTKEGKDRGSAVHAAAYLDIMGKLDKGSVHPKIQPYFEAWKNFRNGVKPRFTKFLCEAPQVNADLLYAGTPDVVCTISGQHFLLDIKTGSSQFSDIQLAAYYNLPLIRMLDPEVATLTLSSNGKYAIKKVKNIEKNFIKFKKLLQKFKILNPRLAA
jgi:hypothetical protein